MNPNPNRERMSKKIKYIVQSGVNMTPQKKQNTRFLSSYIFSIFSIFLGLCLFQF